MDTIQVNKCTIRLVIGDITDMEIQSFVYYARPDLALGSGYGTAITVRGGPGIQKELDALGAKQTTDVVISSAGEMKADYIVHAVGPRFQEQDVEKKLETTVRNALRAAEEKGITAIAFPPMGAGFYAVPLELSAEITAKTVADYLKGDTKLRDVVLCALDKREYQPFQAQLTALNEA